MYLIDREHAFRSNELWGKYTSFLPLTEQINRITLTGFKYLLYLKDIEIGAGLYISNGLEGEEGDITLADGVLIVMESYD